MTHSVLFKIKEEYIMTKISVNELLDTINNQWASTQDIMKIGCVGKNQALKIKKEIKSKLKLEGYFLPKNLVTMEGVLDYFKISINHLKKINECQRGINNVRAIN